MLFVDVLTVLLPFASEFIPVIIEAFKRGDHGKVKRELADAILKNAFEERQRAKHR